PKASESDTAFKKLIEIGPHAGKQVKAALEHDSQPVRKKAALILAALKRRTLNSELKAIVTNPDKHFPNCWEKYSAIVGESQTAKDLFVEMVTEQRQLLQAYEDDPQAANAV